MGEKLDKNSTRFRSLTFGLTIVLAASFALAASPPQSARPASAAPASKRLSADDITLLLIGGASQQKMIAIIHQRGVDFALNPDLVKQFYQDGATDSVIDALQRASEALHAQPAGAPAPAQPATPPSPPAPSPQPPASTAASRSIPAKPGAVQPSHPEANSQPQPSDAPLPDPSPAQIQQIIQTFAKKEQLFEDALQNYTYHQSNKAETIDANGNIDGVWEEDWDVLFGADGKRIEQVTYAPESTLSRVTISKQDIMAFQTLQPFTVTSDTLPEYDIRYMGHVHVDYITCYVFSVRPKEIKKNHIYFKGVVWVDDHDIQVVKAEGIVVPQTKDSKFPRFTTWRQQIDGKYWFPVFTEADDTLYFPESPPIHIKEIVKYTNYRQFKSKYKILSATPIDQTSRAKH
ncbi:MAG: hypothetical protein KGM47_17690 [Acidobacteriota bacterium]|nr:hypothetical protein [Acidobacteriota bacterium]